MNLKPIAIACVLLVGACNTTQIATAHQVAEKAVITADYLYAAIANFANAQVASGAWTAAKAEDLKTQAYGALLQARSAYDVGSVVDLSALTALANQNGIKTGN